MPPFYAPCHPSPPPPLPSTHVGFARSLASLEYMGTLLLNPSLLSTGVLFEQWLPLEGVHNGEVLLR